MATTFRADYKFKIQMNGYVVIQELRYNQDLYTGTAYTEYMYLVFARVRTSTKGISMMAIT